MYDTVHHSRGELYEEEKIIEWQKSPSVSQVIQILTTNCKLVTTIGHNSNVCVLPIWQKGPTKAALNNSPPAKTVTNNTMMVDIQASTESISVAVSQAVKQVLEQVPSTTVPLPIKKTH